MNIRVSEFVDKDDRVEFSFINFDYIDGSDAIAKILHKKCGVIVGEKFDGIYYSVIPLSDGEYKHKLVWHEDVGNYVYSEDQSDESVARLRELAGIAVAEINDKIEKAEAKQT